MKKPEPDEVPAAVAAHTLSLKLPGRDSTYWRWYLSNNRKPKRAVASRIPYRRIGRAVYYRTQDLEAFATGERARLAAMEAARKRPARRRTGRAAGFQWTVEGRHGAASPIHLKLAGLTLTLSLSPAQARAIAAELTRFAERFQLKEGEQR